MNGSLKIIIPEKTDEMEKYYRLRFEILRKPWGQLEHTTLDEWENQSLHALMLDENNEAIATGRLQFNSTGEAQVRSMAVSAKNQGRGFGTRMLQFLESEARKRSIKKIILDARDTAVNFYLKNGYTIEGDSYTLFNVIPHFRMTKDLEQQ